MSRTVAAPRAPGRLQPPFNALMVWLLQSRFHRLVSGSHLLISYSGRKTGIGRTIPVGYAAAGDEVVILVGRAEVKTWWRNFLTPWPVTLLIRGRTIRGTGAVVKGESDQGVSVARTYFERYPGRARGLRLGRGDVPGDNALRSAATGLTFVDVSLPKEP